MNRVSGCALESDWSGHAQDDNVTVVGADHSQLPREIGRRFAEMDSGDRTAVMAGESIARRSAAPTPGRHVGQQGSKMLLSSDWIGLRHAVATHEEGGSEYVVVATKPLVTRFIESVGVPRITLATSKHVARI